MASPAKGKRVNPHKLSFEPVTDSEGEGEKNVIYGHKWSGDLLIKDKAIDSMVSGATLEDRQANSKQLRDAARGKEVDKEVAFKKEKVEKWMKNQPISVQEKVLTVQCCGYDGLWEGAGQEYTQATWGVRKMIWKKHTGFICLKIDPSASS